MRAAFVATLALPLPAAAQDGVDWGGLMAGIAHGTAMDEAAQESVKANRRDASTPRVAAPAERLRYTPSLERRRANLAGFVEKARARDPQGAAALERQFGGGDPIEKIGGMLAPYGMRVDDVADAYAIWWLNAWLASRERNDTPSTSQIAAVRAQAVKAMASVPELVGAADAARQETAEAYLVQAMLIGAMMDAASSKPAQRSQLAAAVRQGAHASGLDLDAMTLSDNGFVPGTSEQLAAVQPGEGSGTILIVGAACVMGLIGGLWLARRRKPHAERQG